VLPRCSVLRRCEWRHGDDGDGHGAGAGTLRHRIRIFSLCLIRRRCFLSPLLSLRHQPLSKINFQIFFLATLFRLTINFGIIIATYLCIYLLYIVGDVRIMLL